MMMMMRTNVDDDQTKMNKKKIKNNLKVFWRDIHPTGCKLKVKPLGVPGCRLTGLNLDH